MSLPADILVYGSLNMDFVTYVHHLPQAGETIAASSFQMAPGGKAANQAVAASRLGSSVAMVGRVGQDELGRQMKAFLAQDGVDCRYVLDAPGDHTGIATIAVDPAGQNSIVTYLGANASVSVEDIDRTAPLLQTARYAILQMEMETHVGEHIIRTAHEAGVRIVLNLAPVVPLDDGIYPLLELLIVNETEASQLTGVAVASLASAREAAEQLLGKGPGHVIVTLGKDGALLCGPGVIEHYEPPRVQAVDATAAGDCFVAAVTHFVNATGDLKEAVRQAVEVAALSVTRKGAQPSLPTMAEYEQFIGLKEVQP
ncbi:ribokinase [Paenibacillus filicis]|uniref:Ribokinase n=1 Tax=Paenibacillus filicis TaxID=669464 RepID=A0ABU9DL03_9BACL